MRIRYLGWAGVEIEADGGRVVVDPLADAGAVFAWMGDALGDVRVPDVVPATPGAVAGLVTHLHRDHADADALRAALAGGATVHEPEDYGGSREERLAILQADRELDAAGLARLQVAPWERVTAGPFTLTALPAVDGTGDPQVSWLIEGGGRRVIHLGDTMWHGWWWRIAARYGAPDVVLAPVNGARLSFPHRQPPSPFEGVMGPEQAAAAAAILGAGRLVPIHVGAYETDGYYEPVADALERVGAAPPALGEAIEV